MAPQTTVTHPFMYDGYSYSKGDVVESHDLAAKFVRLGFAKGLDEPVPGAVLSPQALAEETTTPARKGSKKE